MKSNEFPDYFVSVVAAMPPYAYGAVAAYVESRGINFGPEVSDVNIDKLEAKYGKKFPSAVMHVTDFEWRVLFREHLLDAPPKVLDTIILHEAAHAFVLSQMGISPFNRTKEFNKMLNDFNSSPEITVLKTQEHYNEEETLTLFINMRWGGDEAEANQWVDTHLPS